MHATGTQVIQDGQEMVFQKQHARHHDVGRGDVRFATSNQRVVTGIFRRGVQTERQARKLAAQSLAGAMDRTGQVRVHGHDHHLDRGGLASDLRPT